MGQEMVKRLAGKAPQEQVMDIHRVVHGVTERGFPAEEAGGAQGGVTRVDVGCGVHGGGSYGRQMSSGNTPGDVGWADLGITITDLLTLLKRTSLWLWLPVGASVRRWGTTIFRSTIT